MEFEFVNDILPSEVICINGSMLPEGYLEEHDPDDVATISDVKEKVALMLDKIGELSGVAQGLHIPVTTSDRLRNTDHRVYLLTEPSEGSNGLLVGLLKVGHKKLYLFDRSGRQHELTPLCVLDFYVHESKQRLGCGKKLFESMLQSERASASHLALDRPSEKLLSFLSKHYGLDTMVPQSNNFVVYDSFFDSRDNGSTCSDGRRSNTSSEFIYGRPPAGCGTVRRDSQTACSRRATVANRPHSSMSKIMDANGACRMGEVEAEGDLECQSEMSYPVSPSRCSADYMSPSNTERRDMKFEHQRLCLKNTSVCLELLTDTNKCVMAQGI